MAQRVVSAKFDLSRQFLIPAPLRERNQWVLWRMAPLAKKKTKIPYQPNGKKAATTRPAEWCSFSVALDAYRTGGFDGVGYVFAEDDPYVGIDLDHCVEPDDTGAPIIAPWAKKIVDALNTYTELSPSGMGIHMIVRGCLPPGRRKRDGIEIYSAGRYFTITGALLTPCDQINGNGAIDVIYHEHLGVLSSSSTSATDAQVSSNLLLDPAANPDVDRLMAMIEADTRFKLSWERRRTDLRDSSASGYSLSVASQAAAAGWPDQEIVNLMIAWRRKHNEDLKLARCQRERAAGHEDWYTKTLRRARAKSSSTILHQEHLRALEGLDCIEENDKNDIIGLIRRITNIPICHWRQEGAERAIYSIELDGGETRRVGSAAIARGQDAWQDIAMEITGAPFRRLKADTWQKFLRALGQIREVIENTDTGEKSALSHLIDEYSEGAADETHWQGAWASGHPFHRGGRLHLHVGDFCQWAISLRRERRLCGDPNQVMGLLRMMGWERKTVPCRVGEKSSSKSFWLSPL